MRSGKFGFGIVGCGVIGYWHDLAVRENSDEAEVVAYCDIIRERADKYNLEYADGKCKVYTDYRNLVRDPAVDIVCVCTPSGLHGEVGVAAARADKHILCEKPLEITLDRIDRMIEEAERHKVKLAGIFQRRTYESSQKVKQAIDDGLLGKMVMGDAYLKYFRSQEYYNSGDWRGTWSLDGGGALMNQGIHGIDLLLWLMGDVAAVQAKTRTLSRDIDVEDTAVAIIEYQNGALGVIESATTTNPGEPTQLDLHGVNGSIIYEETSIVKWAINGDENKLAEVVELPAGEAQPAGGTSDPTAISALGHIRHVADLIEAIEQDREPLVTGLEGRRSVELILAIYESSRMGKEVVLQ